jgi:hypothetical protein
MRTIKKLKVYLVELIQNKMESWIFWSIMLSKEARYDEFTSVQQETKTIYQFICCSFLKEIFKNVNSKFWEIKPEIWDEINNVGLR